MSTDQAYFYVEKMTDKNISVIKISLLMGYFHLLFFLIAGKINPKAIKIIGVIILRKSVNGSGE